MRRGRRARFQAYADLNCPASFVEMAGYAVASADVVKWNCDRFWNEEAEHFYPTAKAYLCYYTRWVQNVEVIDPMTVKITLTAPNYEFLRLGVLSCGQARMVSPTAVQELGNDGFARNPAAAVASPFRTA